MNHVEVLLLVFATNVLIKPCCRRGYYVMAVRSIM